MLSAAAMSTACIFPSVMALPPKDTSDGEMNLSLDYLNQLFTPKDPRFYFVLKPWQWRLIKCGRGFVGPGAVSSDSKIVSETLAKINKKKAVESGIAVDKTSINVGNTIAEINKAIKLKADSNTTGYKMVPEVLNSENLNINRLYVINYKDDDGTVRSREVIVNEKKAYENMKKIVDDIKNKVAKMSIEDKVMPDDMYIANEIYKWVATNIRYDNFSFDNADVSNLSDTIRFRRPQNPYFVFDQKLGVCEGKANLLNLMMEIAGIPSAVVSTLKGSNGFGHVYNAIYLETPGNADRTGWTLLDVTGAADGSSDMTGKLTDKNIAEFTDVKKVERKKKWDVGVFDNNPFKGLIESNMILNRNQSQRSALVDYLNEIQKLTYNVVPYNLIEMVNNHADMLAARNDWNNKKIDLNRTSSVVQRSNVEFSNFVATKSPVELFNRVINRGHSAIDPDEKSSMEALNEVLERELNKINAKSKYKDLVKLNKVEVSFDASTELNIGDIGLTNIQDRRSDLYNEIFNHFKVHIETSLNDADARLAAEKEDRIKEFFPAFNDTKASFKELNEHMMLYDAHKILGVAYQHLGPQEANRHWLQDGNYVYALTGQEANAGIMVAGISKVPLKDFELTGKFAKYGINNYKISGGIESLKLKGDETVDLANAVNLKDIDVTKSNIYTLENGVLYEKDKDGKPVKFVCALKKSGKITDDGIRYNIVTENRSGTKIKKIEIGSFNGKKHHLVRLPEFLTKMNVPVTVIGNNIESLALEGDTVVDLSKAKGLKYINIQKSARYEERDGKLFDKNKGREIQLPEWIKIQTPTKNLNIFFKPNKVVGWDANKWAPIYEIDNDFVKKDDIVDISTSFNYYEKGGKIIRKSDAQEEMPVPDGAKVTDKMVTLYGDEVFDMSKLTGKEFINVNNSTRYEERDGKLFAKKKEVQLPNTVKVRKAEDLKIKNLEGNDVLPADLAQDDIVNIEKSTRYYKMRDRKTGLDRLFERVEDKKVDKLPASVQIQKATLILEGEQEFDSSKITGAQYIDITHSTIYKKMDDHKMKDERTGKLIELGKNIVMDDVVVLKDNDELKLEGKNVNYIDLSGSTRYYEKNGEIFEKTKDKELVIPNGVTIVNKTVTLQGDNKLDVNKIKNVDLIKVVTKDVVVDPKDKSKNTYASKKYVVDNGGLIELDGAEKLPQGVRIVK